MTSLGDRALGALDPRVAVPRYDRGAVTASVVHLGVGAFHRAHQAAFHDALLGAGALPLEVLAERMRAWMAAGGPPGGAIAATAAGAVPVGSR